MKISEVQEKILKLKKEQDICILAHSYQSREIVEIADYTGDSFQLSLMAQKTPQKKVIMCGVRFMAETVKILSPEKTVILANPEAGCPMAEQMDKQMIESIKKDFPDYTVVAYINTTAELKTVCDVCVTSSSAVKIVNAIDNKNILFIPDCNLGDYVAKQVKDKNIKLLHGGCPIHAGISVKEAKDAKAKYPDALLLVHPECIPGVVAEADYVGSTSGIMDYASKSDAKEFIIGTEMSIAEHLQYAYPEKKFHILSKKLICVNMKITSLVDVLNSLKGAGGEEINLDETTIRDARKCIDEMIRLG
ncbi:MAG TPA: quinolinate synthase NadA [Spirochaetota bacterium]|nr:quinolinate synthase NadA [Spirochaetota bacterium]HQE59098.1 quinolinate synthase NadA [Spirochaetota bacterium]